MTALHRLAAPGVEAVVSARAAALRLLRVGGVDLVEPTVGSAAPPGMAGAVLAPWPNRVEGARWWHGGREERLPVTEPDLGHANHGLLADVDFASRRATDGEIELGARLGAPPGYPFRLAVAVRYRLRRDGIAVRIAVRNDGEGDAPVALGAHPYLRLGDVPADRLRVRVDADVAYRLDAAHIPREEFPVVDTAWDLRVPRATESIPGHASYRRDGPGRARHLVLDDADRAVELRADAAFRWTQLYLADGFAADDGPRRAIAIEPMTAPPNALRSGAGLRMLAPGETWRPGFVVRLRRGRPRQGRSRER